MTVCIAALCENSQKIVIAADKMITANIPISLQYETDDVKKIYNLTDTCVVLTAGNALHAHEIVQEAKKKVESNSVTSVENMAEEIRISYQEYRLKCLASNVLEPRGLTLDEYYRKHQVLNIGLIQEIDKQLSQFNLGVELIVGGHNDQDCHLFSITNPGSLISHNSIGLACVGIGAPHATYYLIGSEYAKNKGVEEVRELVKQAKKKSEMAPGVGRQTTYMVIPGGNNND